MYQFCSQVATTLFKFPKQHQVCPWHGRKIKRRFVDWFLGIRGGNVLLYLSPLLESTGIYMYTFIYLLYFARTSSNKLQRLMDNEKKKKEKKKGNWPGDYDSKNQLPWALEKQYTTVKTTPKNLAFGRRYCSCATRERAREVPCDVTLRTNWLPSSRVVYTVVISQSAVIVFQ